MSGYNFKVEDFNLTHIFDCGQCFRWREKDDGSYIGIALNTAVTMSLKEEERGKASGKGSLTVEGAAGLPLGERNRWRDYLDLGRDYGAIKKNLSRGDDSMKKAVKYGYGIRILRQELWETIVSFIISQNNNIPRIKGCIESLAENFGEPIGGLSKGDAKKLELPGGLKPYNLPSPEKLARLTVTDLAPVRLGYRAKYLIEAARQVEDGGMPGTLEELNGLCGVGPKVANCIGLFGLGKTDSFPIDVWVKRVMNRLYDFDEEDIKGMAEYAETHFGELSGFAQQYLFYYIRSLGE